MNRLSANLLVLVSVAISIVAAPSAQAQDGRATQSLPIMVDVLDGCEIATTPLVFVVGTATAATRLDSTADINLRCTPNVDFVIEIDDGLHVQGTNRRMFNPDANHYFGYGVYMDPARRRLWGRGRGKTLSGNSGITGEVPLTVYGRTERVSRLRAGDYRDTLTITVTF